MIKTILQGAFEKAAKVFSLEHCHYMAYSPIFPIGLSAHMDLFSKSSGKSPDAPANN